MDSIIKHEQREDDTQNSVQQVSNFDETFEKARNRVQQNRIKKVFKPQGAAKEIDFFSPKFGDNKFRAKSNLKSSTNKDKKEIQ